VAVESVWLSKHRTRSSRDRGHLSCDVCRVATGTAYFLYILHPVALGEGQVPIRGRATAK
jgi:hypothetical protein